MRDLLHRAGCLLQIPVTVGCGYALLQHSELSVLLAALAAIPAGMAATWLVVLVLSVLFDLVGWG
jgi:short subunit fatty acids transporter